MKKYVFKPYSEQFPGLFEREKKRILAVLGGLSIEHVGSTAVPGLGGKGIIDIAIGAKREDFERAKAALVGLGYEFRPSFSTSERLYFVSFLPDEDEGTRRYHVHVVEPEGAEWRQLVGFRDYLRLHPEEAREYAEIKKAAALEADEDGKKYRQLKERAFKKFTRE